MSPRRPYVRSMDGWWRRDPFFVRYMLREATAVFVVAYALVLLCGVVSLAEGEAAFKGWLEVLRTPASVAFHLFLLVIFVYHTWSWFRIMPKTMPKLILGGRQVPQQRITDIGLMIAIVCSAALLGAVVAVGAMS